MNTEYIMREYNEFERKSVNPFYGVQESDNDLTRLVSEDPDGSYISYFNFEENRADSIVKAQLEYFNQRNLSFEWKTYSTDTPANIGSVLLANGFKQQETETFMVLELSKTMNKPLDESLIQEVHDRKGIRDAMKVEEQVWGDNFDCLYAYLVKLKEHSPDSVSIYVISVNGKPVTSAWLIFNGNSPFASIWGGSTLKEFRGRGYYSLLLNKRINEAKARGVKYLIIDASDMSKPIVSKRGFKIIATTTAYTSPE